MQYIKIPSVCPVCGGITTIKKDNESEVLVCTNPDCAGKKLARFTHFVSRKCMNIDGLSERTLELLISNNLIKNFRDIYHLNDHRSKLIRIDGYGVKSIDKLLASIEESRNVKLENFICALGIPNIGSTASKEIAKHFNYSHYNFVQALSDGYNFTQLKDFGEIMNKSLYDWWGSKDPMVELLPLEMHFIVPEKYETNSSLNGLSFCITGSLNKFDNRDALVKSIEAHGGKYVSGVSKKTNYLVNNDTTSTSGKNKKATELGIPIISENDYMEMIK